MARVINWWTRLSPKSLRARLALLSALLLCLIVLVIGLIFYALTSEWLLAQIDQTLTVTGNQVATGLIDPEEPLPIQPLPAQQTAATEAAQAFLQEQGYFVRVLNLETGAILIRSTAFDPPLPEASRRDGPYLETLSIGAEAAPVRVYTLPMPRVQPYAVQVGQSLEELQETQGQMLRLLAFMLIPAATLAAFSGWLLAQRALIPVNVITQTAQAISQDDLSRRIQPGLPDDELGRLAQTFNHMLDRVQSAFTRQQQFTADAAHELRTPLSIMQTGLDVTLAQPREAEAYRTMLESMREEVRRLGQLTGQLLLLARADAHTLPFEPRPTDLSLLLHTVVDQIEVAAGEKQIALRRDIPTGCQLMGDEDRLIQLMLNLLENAVKYTPEGGTITVTLQQVPGYVHFSICDTGIGIPPEHLEHIFDRFYRVDRGRSRQQGGVGLGLAIAHQIARLHGGEITVTSQPGQGSTFTVRLPVSS